MVDFQSRETDRGLGADDDEEQDSEADSSPADAEPEEEAASADETTPADGTASNDETVPTDEPTERADATTAGEAVSVAILVTDDGVAAAADAVADAVDDSHDVLGRDRRTESVDAVQSAVDTFIDQSAVDAVVTVGGVAVGPAQVTVDAVEPLLDARLPGFGELFRRRYETSAGSAAIRTRAFAGVAEATPVFCLPADADAAGTAAAELVAPQLDDLVSEAAAD